MGTETEAAELFRKYGLAETPRVSDPNRTLYQAFGLERGGLKELLGPKVWLRGFKSAILDGHGLGRAAGDVTQMPGVFLISNGEITASFRHHSIADRPDYVSFASCEI